MVPTAELLPNASDDAAEAELAAHNAFALRVTITSTANLSNTRASWVYRGRGFPSGGG